MWRGANKLRKRFKKEIKKMTKKLLTVTREYDILVNASSD